jgi:predicted DCC family thiol-disulfide oxidoreductase YuxK
VDKYVILYDEDCGFCRWSLSKVLALDRDRHLRPVPLQGEESDMLLRRMDHSRKLASWHLVDEEGTIYSGGAALGPLLRILPFGGPFALLASSFPGAGDFLYRLVAANRELLGKIIGEQACAVDPAAVAHRAD